MKLQTFQDIYVAIREGLGIQAADTVAVNKIKRIVNNYYLTEVIPFKRWFWLQTTTQLVHKAFFGSNNTAAVTQGSASVTLATAPSASLGSFVGFRFSTDEANTVYYVDAHVAGSASLTLTVAYQENDNATIGFKVWRDRVDLPANAKETVEVYNPERSRPMEPIGPQRFRELEASDPKMEGPPSYFALTDFVDSTLGSPASDDGSRIRQMKLYPSVTDHNILLNVDFVIDDAPDMVADTDEPLMPIGDRSVLYLGGLARAWSILERNEEMADKWEAKANMKLARMAAERDDGQDTPKLKPKHEYVNAIRRSGLKTWRRRIWRWM